MTILNYQLSSDERTKPYITLIHGLFGSLDNLSTVRRALEHEYNVLSVDLPDHGNSFHSDTFSFESYGNSVVELLNHLNISDTHLLGHSLGGKIGMQVALSFPTKVNKLIVADISPVEYQARHNNVFKALNAVDLDAISSRTEATKLMSEHLDDIGVIQFLLKSLNNKAGNWNWLFNLSMLQRDYQYLSQGISSSSRFDSPTLFIKGGKSDYILSEHRPAIMQLFPQSQAKIISSAGHWLHAEKPDTFNRIISAFLVE